MVITDEIYQESIPSWCSFKTIEEHRNILWFCLGLIDDIENNRNQEQIKNSCQYCEFYESEDIL